MLVIRKEQVDILKEGMLKEFEDEMVEHLAQFSPPLYKVLKEDQTREAVRFGFKQSERYGFTLRGPIRLYLEMMLLFGSHFDSDPQYPWAREILVDKHSIAQMQRADWLYEKILDFQEKVSGPNGEYTRKAMEGVRDIGSKPLNLSESDYDDAIRREIHRIFPQKVDYIGSENLLELIRQARLDARKYDFPSTRGDTLMVVLKFAFGNGCGNDPLYPWIERTLTDDKIVDAKARAERLEKKSMTWLDHVLKGSLGSEEI
jgi:hypothetical protein